MALVSNTPRTTTLTPAAGLTGPFQIGFRLFDTDEVRVYQGGRRVTASVTATFIDGYTDSATITLAQPSTGEPIRIDGAMRTDRQDDLIPTDPRLIQLLNNEFARLWAALSEVRRDADRSVRGFTPVEPLTHETGRLLIATPDGYGMGPTADEIANAQTYAERAEAAATLIGGALERYPDLPSVLAQPIAPSIGNIIETQREGFTYEVLPSSTGAHLTTAAPAYLKVLNKDGAYNARAFDVRGDGTANDSAKVQTAVDEPEVQRLIFDRGDYRVGEILIGRSVEIAAANGNGEVTTNATGTPNTSVRFRYIGGGGVGSRIFTFKAPAVAQWIRGGGIIGKPHLNGAGICEIGVHGASLHYATFDMEVSRCAQAGMRLDGSNEVLSQFCDVDLKYVWGTDTAATGNSHGIVLNGNHPNGVGWTGCTQHTIRMNGLIHDGNMVHMVGHCDNNHLVLRASKGTGTGTGYTLAIYPGNGGKAGQVNRIDYLSNDAYFCAESYGNVLHFTTAESLRIVGSGQYTFGDLVSYTTGKTFRGLAAPLTDMLFFSATEFFLTGAASRVNVGSTPVAVLQESGNADISAVRHNPIWGAGRVSEVSILYRADAGASGNANVTVDLTTGVLGGGLASIQSFNQLLPMSSTTSRVTIPVVPAKTIGAEGICGVKVSRLPASAGDTSTHALHVLGVVVRIDFDGPSDMETPLPAWTEKV